MPDKPPLRRVARVVVDRAKCQSHEQCVAVAPAVFSMDSTGYSVVGDIRLADDETLLKAARACPMLAIIVWDEQGNQIYPRPGQEW